MSFEKGKSGNPNGRPKLTGEFKQALSESTMEALNVIRDVMNDITAKNGDRITAAKYILDKSLGINYQLFSEDDEDNAITVKIIRADNKNKKKEKKKNESE